MLIQAGQRITAALLTSLGLQTVIKGADQAYPNTTLTADNALSQSLVANATYLFACYLNYEGGTLGNSDLKWGWGVPSGTTMRYTVLNRTTAGAADDGLTQTESSVPTAGTAGAGNLRGVLMLGSIVAGSTAGTLQLKCAQNTSNVTATTVHAQSLLALGRSM